MGECGVCFEEFAPIARFLPCQHQICTKCAVRCIASCKSCPFCRQLPYALVDADVRLYTAEALSAVLSVPFFPGAKPGVTVAKRGALVVVVRLDKRDALHRAGVRVDDELVRVNNIPCTDPRVVVDLLDRVAREAETRGEPVPCEIGVVRTHRARCCGLWTFPNLEWRSCT